MFFFMSSFGNFMSPAYSAYLLQVIIFLKEQYAFVCSQGNMPGWYVNIPVCALFVNKSSHCGSNAYATFNEGISLLHHLILKIEFSYNKDTYNKDYKHYNKDTICAKSASGEGKVQSHLLIIFLLHYFFGCILIYSSLLWYSHISDVRISQQGRQRDSQPI